MEARREAFFRRGWRRFDFDPLLAAWAEAACPVAWETLHDPDLRALAALRRHLVCRRQSPAQ